MKKVLLVEDDDLLRKSLCGLIGTLGYGSIPVDSAEEALHRAQQEMVDLVLTDYRLVCMNGIDLIMALRKTGINVPCVLISGYLTEEARQQALEVHVTDILRKPGDLARLGEILPELLGAAA